MCQAQTIWPDTLRTFVKLGQYDLGNKIVLADTRRVIMFFRQSDYFGKETTQDTVKTSPRYFNDHKINDLLKQGKVRIIRKLTNSEVYEINHRLVQYASECDREYEFSDGVSFWRQKEIIGIYNPYVYQKPDSIELERRVKIVPKKDFDPDFEEFPDRTQNHRFRISEYFPEKIRITYLYKIGGGYYEYIDTIGHKSSKIDKQNVFYFPYLGYSKFKSINTKTTMFGDGGYFYKNDSLFTLEVEYEQDLIKKSIKNAKLLFPAEMSIGDSINIEYGYYRKTLTFIKKESIIAGSREYEDCVKIKIITYWPNTIYISYVWLKKDIGMVKWVRDTGRIDELVNTF